MSTSLEIVLVTPPKTYIWPFKLSPRVLLVGPRYVSNRADSVRHWIKDKRVCRIRENAARDIGSSTCVDYVADGSGRYIAKRNWQG